MSVAIMIEDPETSPTRIPKLETRCVVHLRGKEQDTRRMSDGWK